MFKSFEDKAKKRGYSKVYEYRAWGYDGHCIEVDGVPHIRRSYADKRIADLKNEVATLERRILKKEVEEKPYSKGDPTFIGERKYYPVIKNMVCEQRNLKHTKIVDYFETEKECEDWICNKMEEESK